MDIIRNSLLETRGVVLILGFFDGIHLGHRNLITSAVNYAKINHSKTVLLTFSKSPSEYFNKNFDYIYSRDESYKLISSLHVDYIIEQDFSNIVALTANEYLDKIVKQYSPIAIFTGFNHTFGANKVGNKEFLEKYSNQYNYQYFPIKPTMIENEVVSSTLIKNLLKVGDIEKANMLLGTEFFIQNIVEHGEKRGSSLGFPTANLSYPQNIIQIPYGVYSANIFNKKAVLNWGTKPTFDNKKPVLEAHIIDFNENLYKKTLEIKLIKKIRDEIKFLNISELKEQIKKDIEEC